MSVLERHRLEWFANPIHYPDPDKYAMARRIIELERENARLKELVEVDHEGIQAEVEGVLFHAYSLLELAATSAVVARTEKGQ